MMWPFRKDHGACGLKRDPNWRYLAKGFLLHFPCCAVCGKKDGVVPHHMIPFHVDRRRELNVDNLIPLCPDHHLWFGHLGLWQSWNPDVLFDCGLWRTKIEGRPTV